MPGHTELAYPLVTIISQRISQRFLENISTHKRLSAMYSITNAVAIFGATGGLGEAVAERLAKEGAITLGYFGGKEKCQALVARIEASGESLKAFACFLMPPFPVRAESKIPRGCE